MTDSLFYRPHNLFEQLNSLHRALSRSLSQDGVPDAIRSVEAGTFPAINVARTSESVEIYAFAPGLDPASIDVTVERGVLKISGERKPFGSGSGSGSGESTRALQQYAAERPYGRFSRALSLPDDCDTSKVVAKYRDGILSISVGVQRSAQPQRIDVQ